MEEAKTKQLNKLYLLRSILAIAAGIGSAFVIYAHMSSYLAFIMPVIAYAASFIMVRSNSFLKVATMKKGSYHGIGIFILGWFVMYILGLTLLLYL
ncbi:MAG: hypothetical protein JRN19_02475 [Nitrososphaerota archaeon]|nr:hypothetical protein [Nitrososphaerota archaeon]MDG7034635.1 hypothetical protein [Nitrososphaerota archaeon]MDG7043868.1 hypothetical protein [Nitrososphaerota archaeon]MDG7051300.1 hypothetical protein [Nitrososphaerota archaeon]